MASTFPTALDTIPDSPTTQTLGGSSPTHPEMHDKLRDAIAAVEARIGITGSVDPASLTKQLADVSSAVSSHGVAADPHTQYTTAAEVASLAPAETTTTTGALVDGATEKTTPVDGDSFGLSDSAASGVLKKFSWASLKAAVLSAVFGAGYAKTVCNVTTPWLYCPSSTVVAGGAGSAYITLGTALPAAITVPGKCYVPAVGSLSAGWYDFSSATTTQINLVDAVTTGGAFTATINTDVAGPGYTMPGGSMGKNGRVKRAICAWTNNSAGSKNPRVYWDASSVWNLVITTTVTASLESATWNKDNVAAQSTATSGTSTIYGVSSANAVNTTAVDTETDVSVFFAFRIAIATDYLCLLAWNEQITYGA